MRRMMHAAFLFAALFSSTTLSNTASAQAQQNSLLIQDSGNVTYNSPVTEGSTIYSENVQNYAQPAQTHHYHDVNSGSSNYSEPQFLKFGSCRPHSSIGLLMQCDYSSRNLWAGYGQQRAALVAHMMRHVDGTCDCCRTYDQACHTGGNGCGSDCNTGCGPVAGNRYKLASLHASPTSECATGTCGSACGTGCGKGLNLGWRHSNRPFTFGAPETPYCNTCNSAEPVSSPYTAQPYTAQPYGVQPYGAQPQNVPQYESQPVPQVAPTPAPQATRNGYNAPYRTR